MHIEPGYVTPESLTFGLPTQNEKWTAAVQLSNDEPTLKELFEREQLNGKTLAELANPGTTVSSQWGFSGQTSDDMTNSRTTADLQKLIPHKGTGDLGKGKGLSTGEKVAIGAGLATAPIVLAVPLGVAYQASPQFRSDVAGMS